MLTLSKSTRPATRALIALLALAGTATGQHVDDAASSSPGPVNAVLGDVSFERAFGDARLARHASELLRIGTHLDYVADLLRRRDVDGWPTELRHARRSNLQRLDEYRAAGVFPRNYDHPEQRRPCFIDRDGRICAVGYLVEQSAGRDLAEAINRQFQYALLADIDDPALDAWVASSGLTELELAMIQPSYNPCGRAPCASNIALGPSCLPPHERAPIAVDESRLWASGWALPPAGAGWIGSFLGAALPGEYVYRTTFALASHELATAAIHGEWATDAGHMLLNGAPTGVSVPSGSAYALQPFTIRTGFVTGLNTLEIRVRHSGGELGLVIAIGQASADTTQHRIAGLFSTGVDANGVPIPIGAADPHYLLVDQHSLLPNSRPGWGNADYTISIAAAPAHTPAALLFSLGEGSTPLGGGCSLLIDPSTWLATVPGQTDALGRATFRLPIGFGPGPWVVVQAVVVDPAGPLVGLNFTNGLSITGGV